MNDPSFDSRVMSPSLDAGNPGVSIAAPPGDADQREDEPREIELSDPREYAWLLERAHTVIDDVVSTWNWIPIRDSSLWSRILGYPARFVLVFVTALLGAALAVALVLVLVEIPVTIFVFIEPLVPDWIWWSITGTCVACIAYYLILVIGVQINLAARGEEGSDQMPSLLRDNVVASTVDENAGWKAGQSLHISHDSARRTLFAGLFIILGMMFQFAAVVIGPAWFEGSVATFWQWPLMFAEGFINTMMLGVPESLLTPFSDIEPRGIRGKLLLVAVDVCYAGGLLTILISSFATSFKPRELFNGTIRDLADYIENVDISGKHLTIHRIAVVRPLDEQEVITLSRDEFFARIKMPA